MQLHTAGSGSLDGKERHNRGPMHVNQGEHSYEGHVLAFITHRNLIEEHERTGIPPQPCCKRASLEAPSDT